MMKVTHCSLVDVALRVITALCTTNWYDCHLTKDLTEGLVVAVGSSARPLMQSQGSVMHRHLLGDHTLVISDHRLCQCIKNAVTEELVQKSFNIPTYVVPVVTADQQVDQLCIEQLQKFKISGFKMKLSFALL